MKKKQMDNYVILSTVLNQESTDPDLVDSDTESAYYIMENGWLIKFSLIRSFLRNANSRVNLQ